MPSLDDDRVRAYLAPHAHGMVERALREYPTLSECIAVLSLADGAPPRLVPRATAVETLRSEGKRPELFADHLGARDEDDLAVVIDDGAICTPDLLTSQRSPGQPAKAAMAVFPQPRTAVDHATLAAAVAPLRASTSHHLRSKGDAPGAYLMFWAIFESSPFVVARDAAKATLGKHPKWKEILPYLYTPHEELLVLLQVDGKLVPIVGQAPRSREEAKPAEPASAAPVAGRPQLVTVSPAQSSALGAGAAGGASAPKKSKGVKRDLEKYARPYLKIAIETCDRTHGQPRDYYLLIGKYEPEKGLLVPRSLAEETIAIGRSKVGREKMQKLVAMPCEEKQLLVIITAGDHVEGGFIRVPTIAPHPDKAYVTREEMDAVELYQRLYAPSFSHAVDVKGKKLADYVAILRLPDGRPTFGTRGYMRPMLEAEGFGDVVKELDVPAKNDDELLCVYKLKGKPVWSRLQFPSRDVRGA